MTRILSFLIIVTITFSCQTHPRKGVKRVEVESVQTKERIEELFLDFRFGMTMSEFNSHVNLLVSQSKLVLENGRYHADLTISEYKSGEVKAYLLNPDMYQDSLYRLNLKVIATEPLNAPLVYPQLSFMLSKKYGFTNSKEIDVSHTVISSSNLEVKISSLGSEVLLSYVDSDVEELVDLDNKNKMKKEAQKTFEAL